MSATAPRTLPSDLRLMAGEAVSFDTARADKGVRAFKMLAYSGAEVDRWGEKMIVDLKGLQINGQKKPILRDHDSRLIAGFSESIANSGKELRAEGSLSPSTPTGREVASLSDEGFPWQASMSFAIQSWREVGPRQSLEINGREFTGPGVVVTKSRLREISFTPFGADDNTSGIVLSDAGAPPIAAESKGDESMTPEEFAKANAAAVEAWKTEGGKTADAATLTRLAALSAAFPDRPAFVLEQFRQGCDVPGAKAALADVLLAEAAAKDKTIAELTAKAAEKSAEPDGHAGVKFTPNPVSGTATGNLPPEQRAKVEWESNARFGDHSVRDTFGSEAEYAAHLTSVARGQSKAFERV